MKTMKSPAGGDTPMASSYTTKVTEVSPPGGTHAMLPLLPASSRRRMIPRDEGRFHLERRVSIVRAILELEEENPGLNSRTVGDRPPELGAKAAADELDEKENGVTTGIINQVLEIAANLGKNIHSPGRPPTLNDILDRFRKSNERVVINATGGGIFVKATALRPQETDEDLEVLWDRLSAREKRIAMAAYRHQYISPVKLWESQTIPTLDCTIASQEAQSPVSPLGLGISLDSTPSGLSPLSGSIRVTKRTTSPVRQRQRTPDNRVRDLRGKELLSMVDSFNTLSGMVGETAKAEVFWNAPELKALTGGTRRSFGKDMTRQKASNIQSASRATGPSQEIADWETITTERATSRDDDETAATEDEDFADQRISTAVQLSPRSRHSLRYIEGSDPFITSAVHSPGSLCVDTNKAARKFKVAPAIQSLPKGRLIPRTQPVSPNSGFLETKFVDTHGFAYPNSPEDPDWDRMVARARDAVLKDEIQAIADIERAPPELKEAAKLKAKSMSFKRTKKDLEHIMQRQSIYGWVLKKPLEYLTNSEHQVYCETLLAGKGNVTENFREQFFELHGNERGTAKRLCHVVELGERGRATRSVNDDARAPPRPIWTQTFPMGMNVAIPLGNELGQTRAANVNNGRACETYGGRVTGDPSEKNAAPQVRERTPDVTRTNRKPRQQLSERSVSGDLVPSSYSSPFDRHRAAQMVERRLNPARFSLQVGSMGVDVARYLEERGAPITPLPPRQQQPTGLVAVDPPVAPEDTDGIQSSTPGSYADGPAIFQPHTPVMRSRPDSKAAGSGAPGSFFPSRRETFQQKLSEERAKKLGQLGTHPALSPSMPSPSSPTAARLPMPPFSAQETERIGYLREGEKVRARFEGVKNASKQGSPVSLRQFFRTAPLPQTEPSPPSPCAHRPATTDIGDISIDDVARLWEKVPDHSSFDDMQEAVDNEFRVSMGRQPLAAGMGASDHPSHPFGWNAIPLKCRDSHVEDSIDDSKTCETCGVYCCCYAELREISTQPFEDDEEEAAEAERLKADCINAQLPRGDLPSVFLRCGKCGEHRCPDCCVRLPDGIVICHVCNTI